MCARCISTISSRGGFLQCNNCGWMAPSQPDTTSEAAEVPGAKDVERSTPPYSADNGDSKGVAALDRSRAPVPLSSKVVSIQDGMFVCTDGAGFFTRPATDDEGLFWAEVIRLRTEHEEDLNRMERAAEAVERLTAERDQLWKERDELRETLAHLTRGQSSGETTVATTDHAANLAVAVEAYIVAAARISAGGVEAAEWDSASDTWRAVKTAAHEYRKHFPPKTSDQSHRQPIDKPPQLITGKPECPTCRTELAFEGDVCGLCP
jgi:hypothetical protein